MKRSGIQSFTSLILFISLLLGCSNPYSPSLEKVIKVNDSDFAEVQLGEPQIFDPNILGCCSLKCCDSLLLVTGLGLDNAKLIHVFSSTTLRHLGSFLTKGRGPSELLGAPYCSRFCFDEDDGDIIIRFLDSMSGKMLKMNLSESLRSGGPVVVELAKFKPMSPCCAVVIEDSVYFEKFIVEKPLSQERVLKSFDKDIVTSQMAKLNSYHLDKSKDSFDVNFFSAVLGYSRERNTIVEAMSVLNSIQVYSLEDDDCGFTICYGDSLYDIHDMQNVEEVTVRSGYVSPSVHKDFFVLMYVEETQLGKKNIVQIYSWDGRPLVSIPLPSDVIYFDIDESTGRLWTLCDDNRIRIYPSISQYLPMS